MRVNDCKGYLCKYPEGDKKQDIIWTILLLNFVIYGGKASVFSPCVDAIHLTSCLKIQKKYPIKISERKAGGNKNTNQKRPN